MKHAHNNPSTAPKHWARRALLAAALTLPTALWAQAPEAPSNVRISTSMGDIVLQLDAQKAPKTVANFVRYVQDKHYDGTVFHRVIGNFMAQGGGFDPDMQQKPTRAPIALEANNGLKNDRGTVAMARTANPNSATAQFFINLVDNDGLNAPKPDGHGYAVFGRVVSGMEVLEEMRKVPTGNKGMHQNVPKNPITILKATLEK